MTSALTTTTWGTLSNRIMEVIRKVEEEEQRVVTTACVADYFMD